MRRHIARTLTSLTLAGAMLGLAAPSAHAAPSAPATPSARATPSAPAAPSAPASRAAKAGVVAVNMTLNAPVETVVQGDSVKLTGRVWLTATGNSSRIEFYFQRAKTTTWAYAGFVNSTDRGDYSKRTTAKYSGTWKAVYRGTATRRGTLRLDVIRVARPAPQLIATYRGTTVNWQGKTIRVPSADYQVIVKYNCTDPDGYMFFNWNGDDYGFETVSSSRPAGTLQLNGHAGARSGFFEVSTWIGCTWSAEVFASTAQIAV